MGKPKTKYAVTTKRYVKGSGRTFKTKSKAKSFAKKLKGKGLNPRVRKTKWKK